MFTLLTENKFLEFLYSKTIWSIRIHNLKYLLYLTLINSKLILFKELIKLFNIQSSRIISVKLLKHINNLLESLSFRTIKKVFFFRFIWTPLSQPFHCNKILNLWSLILFNILIRSLTLKLSALIYVIYRYYIIQHWNISLLSWS